MSLKVVTARNSLIMGGVQFAMRPINFVIAIILARLLDPSDFGLVALALVLVQTSNQFTALGMDKAIIQSQEERGKVAFHAFAAVMFFGALFFALIQIYSTTLAGWLGNANTEPVLLWLSVLVLLNALAVVPQSLLRKDLSFHHIATSGLLAELLYTVVVLVMAYSGLGLWSLVFANLIKTAFNTAVYWLVCPGWDWIIPKRWEWPLLGRLLRYGSQASASGLLSYFHTHWDDWMVGRVLGVEQLGFYAKSYDFSNSTIGQMIRNTLGMVFLPSYVKIQENRPRLMRAYLKSVRLVTLMIVPIALGIFVVAEPLVQVVFGDKWMPMVPALQIFALLILTRPVSENTSPLFHAVGLPRNNLQAGFVLLIVMVPGVLWFLNSGIAGVAVAVAGSHLVGALYNIYQVEQILPGSARETAKITLPILGIGLVMMLGVQLAKFPVEEFWGTLFSVPALLSLVATGALLYLIGLVLTQRDIIVEMRQTVIELLPKRLPLSKSRA
ncbi:MAG TPA: lipopolysaccharide biosynthesis protein [Caldilineaceae bacterium]|nr:lipopolysaccharide biosynthesis protein [Caldilineaceae bacterium]